MNEQKLQEGVALLGVSMVTGAGAAFRAESVFAIGLVGLCLWMAIMIGGTDEEED